jgi:hypothetical protein
VIRLQPRPGGALAFAVERQPGAAAGVTASFTLRISYDEGRTWRTPLFTRIGEHGVAVPHPPTGSSVSVRTTAVDTDGNRVEQTVLRAYA